MELAQVRPGGFNGIGRNPATVSESLRETVTSNSYWQGTTICESARPMSTSEQKIHRQRQLLDQELSAIRQKSLAAARNDDFRSVAKLTLEAARVNRSIAEADTQAELLFR